MPTSSPSLIQLRQAIALTEQIQKLEAELQAIFSGGESGGGGKSAPVAAAAEAPKARGRKKGKKAKRVLSPEGRAAIVAALKARHAAKKKAK